MPDKSRVEETPHGVSRRQMIKGVIAAGAVSSGAYLFRSSIVRADQQAAEDQNNDLRNPGSRQHRHDDGRERGNKRYAEERLKTMEVHVPPPLSPARARQVAWLPRRVRRTARAGHRGAW